MRFSKGRGWLFHIGCLFIYQLSIKSRCWLKPWRDSSALYWLRLAFEIKRGEAHNA
jgi:hypothetical protein